MPAFGMQIGVWCTGVGFGVLGGNGWRLGHWCWHWERWVALEVWVVPVVGVWGAGIGAGGGGWSMLALGGPCAPSPPTGVVGIQAFDESI